MLPSQGLSKGLQRESIEAPPREKARRAPMKARSWKVFSRKGSIGKEKACMRAKGIMTNKHSKDRRERNFVRVMRGKVFCGGVEEGSGEGEPFLFKVGCKKSLP